MLVGGSDAPPCPPNADCAPPETAPLADGAAYDPEAGAWRRVADSPVGFAWAQTIVFDASAYLWIPDEPWRPEARSAFLAYRIEESRWEELPMPTKDPNAYYLLAAGDRIVAYSWGDEPREQADFVFAPGAKTWSELPDDPLSRGFDRFMIWNGEKLLLFDHELVPNPGGNRPPLPLRGAVLDLGSGEWTVLADPEADLARSGWEDPSAWEDRPAGVVDESGARYERSSGPVLDQTTGSWLQMPELEALGEAYGGTTEVTAGTDLFVFLGSTWPEGDEDGELHAEAWLWSPRS